jgi:peroxiredoxin
MSWLEVVAAGAAVLMLAEGAVILLLLRQHGETLIGHDRLAERLVLVEHALNGLTVAITGRGTAGANGQPTLQPPAIEPLKNGTRAPHFELSSPDGKTRALEELVGDKRVVVFFDPQCGFCQSMAPEIGQLDDPSRLVLISRGTADQQREMKREHGWGCEVLLDPSGQVAQAYQTIATPTGYVIDGSGCIASSLLVGAEAILDAASTISPQGSSADTLREKERDAAARAQSAGLPVKDIRHSRIARDGLSAGTPAPEFSLPDIAGKIRCSSEFLGKRTLLVFSDPDCGPCQQLAPTLARLHQSLRPGHPQIVMISRGDLDTNRMKAEQHGITFPLLIQKGWAVSKQYGIFATPVGYLINQHGQIEHDVAIGAEAILQLVSA